MKNLICENAHDPSFGTLWCMLMTLKQCERRNVKEKMNALKELLCAVFHLQQLTECFIFEQSHTHTHNFTQRHTTIDTMTSYLHDLHLILCKYDTIDLLCPNLHRIKKNWKCAFSFPILFKLSFIPSFRNAILDGCKWFICELPCNWIEIVTNRQNNYFVYLSLSPYTICKTHFYSQKCLCQCVYFICSHP